ncbi:MAG: branched-chain amino acid ABC transporter permease [Acidimicrobiia bacterium]|nr:branched-chain amino acid ABC transporter permease [Acidimicrobiia bacterium]
MSFVDQLSTALVIGVITGGVYALVALGLVLVYKASGVFNFAQAEFGTVAVYAAYAALEFAGLPYGIALLVGVSAGVAMGLATERLIIRPLFDAPRVTLLVATAGVALLVIGVQFWRANDPALRVLAPISNELERVRVFGISVSDQRIVILLVLAATAAGLALFFRSPGGLAVLAASQEPTAAELVGVSVRRVSSLTWGVAALLGSLAGLLSAPISNFSPGFLTAGASGALIPGFTGAVIGGMTSMPGAVVGGLLVGIVESLGGLNALEGIPGARSLLVFASLLVVLLVRPQGLLGRAAA